MARKVFALGFLVGTPTAVKYVPLAEKHQIPLVGLFTGAQTLYTPLRHWVITCALPTSTKRASRWTGR
jgi:branched-chain amino acid transport system substrate-binding protein